MVWATRRGMALALLCAPACASGVSLEGSGVGETPGATEHGHDGGDAADRDAAGHDGPRDDARGGVDDFDDDDRGRADRRDGGVEHAAATTTTTGAGAAAPGAVPVRPRALADHRVRGGADAGDRAGAGQRRHDVFAKIGGTTTASVNFMQCLATDAEIVKELPPELVATRDFFNVELEPGVTSFTRDSTAAVAASIRRSAERGLVGGEVAAILPRFAHVLVGTHDLASDQPAALYTFADNLLDIVDELMAGGVVPILSTLPLRSDMPLKSRSSRATTR
jgi:hypothetical protein